MPYLEITISPPYRSEDPRQLWVKDEERITQILNTFSKHYMLYPEFTDKESRLHYHGIVHCHDDIKRHKVKWKLDRIGLTKIGRFNTFKSRLTWLTYSLKSYASCRALLPPIRYRNRRKRKTFQRTMKFHKISNKRYRPSHALDKEATLPGSKFIIKFDTM